MAKETRTLDVVLQKRPAIWHAHVLGDEDVAAVGSTDVEALARLEKLAERVLRHYPDRFPDREGTVVPRHIRLDIPAVRMGRVLDLELQLFAACREMTDITVVNLPQVGLEFEIKDPDEIERVCGEYLRDRFPPDGRLPALLSATEPLVEEGPEDPAPLFRVEQLHVRFRPDAATRKAAEQDSAPTLTAVGEALHHRLARKDAPRAFERRSEVDTLLDYLADSAERSVLLVGPPGVGKTAIVYEAVRRMLKKNAPEMLHDTGVWQISGGRLMAGMRYLGEWQERVLELINDVKATGGILFAENLIELLETAGTEKYAEGIPGLLLPHILSGDIVLVTEAQPDQLARAEQSHPSFLRALRRLPIEPLDPARTDEVLRRVSFRLGRQFGVRLSQEARQRVLELVGRFKGSAALPGPAVELAERMARTHRRRAVDAEGEDRPVLEPAHAIEAYGSLTGLPMNLIDPEARFDVDEIRAFFDDRIFAQPEAVDAVVDLVTCIRAGLNSPQRPLGSFLFLGPTGVGKTQTALTLSEYLFGSPDRLVRFDMSEYQDAWAAGRLVGRYRGERGELVRRVREQPFLVLLLDEIEKAHANVFDFLLQVLGEGRLTDGLGRTVSLTSAVVIMTSNLGSGGPPSVGFSAGDEAADRAAEVAHYMGEVESFFRPEFVGRIDRVIPFRSLGSSTARRLVERALEQAFAREGLRRRKVSVRATDAVIDFLIKAGLDPRYGARPLRRAVENYITAPLGKFLSRESGIEDIDIVIDMVEGLPSVDVE
jgi:ATP-dependent Clp protease ATP-binding subunit ClpC